MAHSPLRKLLAAGALVEQTVGGELLTAFSCSQ